MFNADEICFRANIFKNIKARDRVFFKNRGKVMTRRVVKVNKCSVVVLDGSDKIRVSWDKIFMA